MLFFDLMNRKNVALHCFYFCGRSSGYIVVSVWLLLFTHICIFSYAIFLGKSTNVSVAVYIESMSSFKAQTMVGYVLYDE